MNNIEKLLELVKENPDLPIVPMVDGEIAADDCGYWMGKWGDCKIEEYYLGEEKLHFKDDDEENVLCDMVGCRCCCTLDGKDIYDLSDDEWKELYQDIPWIKCIVVYIDMPD